jgi:GT2 family glycosyltransferase
MISVLISTLNRPQQIRRCLSSLLKNSYSNFEILLVDQSTNNETEEVVHQLRSKKIKYIRMYEKGKAKALNLMIRRARSSILAFTDDDCVVNRDWFQEISTFYRKCPRTAGVFGNIYPYRPKQHLHECCPATFTADKVRSFSDPGQLHYHTVGQGNNMSLRKSVIERVGGFKEWLGVGSIAQAGEESDLIFRILLDHHILMTNPKMIAFHDRWMTSEEENLLQTRYTCGLFAFFTYYLLSSHAHYAVQFIKARVSDRSVTMIKELKGPLRDIPKKLFFLFVEILGIMKGTSIGLFMFVEESV